MFPRHLFDLSPPPSAEDGNMPLVSWSVIKYRDIFAFPKDDISKEVLSSKNGEIAPAAVDVVLQRE
jgi:hypothetical protein